MILTAPALLLALAGPAVQAGTTQRTAVVVGIESYQHLGPELRVVSARDDAMRVAEALETRAGFQHVQLLTDASATRGAIESLLAGGLGLDGDDLFLLYFVGHGVGGDFGEPRLLTYDSDPDAIEQTTWPVAELAATLVGSIQAGAVVLVTDASHAGSIQDLALMGPSPDQWPAMDRPSMVISAAGPREPAQPKALAEAFAGGVSGRADTSSDGLVTSGELYRHLVRTVPAATADAQHPTVSAGHDPTFTVASLASRADAEPAEHIDKVKFIFRSGISPTVQCSRTPVTACDPSCYLWDPEPGTCTASAIIDDHRESVELQVLQRGSWVCQDTGTGLACTPGP
jgi:uncharacterized caspase-like protein